MIGDTDSMRKSLKIIIDDVHSQSWACGNIVGVGMRKNGSASDMNTSEVCRGHSVPLRKRSVSFEGIGEWLQLTRRTLSDDPSSIAMSPIAWLRPTDGSDGEDFFDDGYDVTFSRTSLIKPRMLQNGLDDNVTHAHVQHPLEGRRASTDPALCPEVTALGKGSRLAPKKKPRTHAKKKRRQPEN